MLDCWQPADAGRADPAGSTYVNIPRLIPALGEPIGFLPSGVPVYPVFGGAEDVEIEPDEDEGGEEEESEEEEGDEPKGKRGKYAPPDESEWLKTRTALSKANASAKQRREALAESAKKIAELEAAAAKREADDERRALLEAQRQAAAEAAGDDTGRRGKKRAAAGGGGVPAPTGLPDGVMTKSQVRQATAQAAKEAEEQAAEKYRNMAVGAVARGALVAEGVSKEAADKLTRLLDLGEIELDENGQVVSGLDEQMEALKTDFPQLFAKPEPEKPRPRRAPVPRAGAAPKPEAETRILSSAERMAQQVLGSR